MNTVLLELNSYTQEAKIFLNGKEPSLYSELNNYSYTEIIDNPDNYLEAIGRVLNDDFSLQITANDYLYDLLSEAAQDSELCDSCKRVPMKLSYSTRKRVNKLSEFLTPKEFVVGLNHCIHFPDPVKYGPITVIFTSGEDIGCDLYGSLDQDRQISDPCDQTDLLSFVETCLIDPLIGQAVDKLGPEKQYERIYKHISPMKVANCSTTVSMAAKGTFSLMVCPLKFEIPETIVVSSDRSVFTIGQAYKIPNHPGLFYDIIPHSVGEAEISATVKGENKPFFTKLITVRAAVYASRINFSLNKEILVEGDTVSVKHQILPSNAEDKNRITFKSSDSRIAEVVSDTLKLKAPGSFTLTAYGEKVSTSQDFTVKPQLRGVSINPSSCTLIAGESKRMMIVPEPKGAYMYLSKKSSSKESVATIGHINSDGSFCVETHKRGKCRISIFAEDDTYEAVCEVTVRSRILANLKKAFKSFENNVGYSIKRFFRWLGDSVPSAAGWIWEKIGLLFDFGLGVIGVGLSVILLVIALTLAYLLWGFFFDF